MSADHHIQKLGRTAVDRVTGFRGVITTVSFDLYGCVQLVLTPKAKKGEQPKPGGWFDANRLELEDKKRAMEVPSFEYASEGHGPAEKPGR